jgi:Cu/Ag efflux protein CusF
MKPIILSLLALLVLAPAALPARAKADSKPKNCGCACCQGQATCCCDEETAAAEAAKPGQAMRYPLKGVIVDLLADQTALLVKHEAIPGYMKAMTMMFRVDPASFKNAAKGQIITATLIERDGGHWLENINPAVESPKVSP